jgi:hypothetical protein
MKNIKQKGFINIILVVIVVAVVGVAVYVISTRETPSPITTSTPQLEESDNASQAPTVDAIPWEDIQKNLYKFLFEGKRKQEDFQYEARESFPITYTDLSGKIISVRPMEVWALTGFLVQKVIPGPIHPNAPGNLYQQLTVRAYGSGIFYFTLPEYTDHETTTFYNLDISRWIRLKKTFDAQREIPTDINLVPTHTIINDRVNVSIYDFGERAGVGSPDTSHKYVLVIYKKPVPLVLFFYEDTNCKGIMGRIDNRCSFYKKNLLDLNKEFLNRIFSFQ